MVPSTLMRPILVMALLLAACKGDAVKCDQGCRNYFALKYWDVTDKELAAAPPEQRDALRKAKQVELKGKIDSGIAMCVSQCQSANHTEDIECMVSAKTAAQAATCFK